MPAVFMCCSGKTVPGPGVDVRKTRALAMIEWASLQRLFLTLACLDRIIAHAGARFHPPDHSVLISLPFFFTERRKPDMNFCLGFLKFAGELVGKR